MAGQFGTAGEYPLTEFALVPGNRADVLMIFKFLRREILTAQVTGLQRLSPMLGATTWIFPGGWRMVTRTC